MRREGRLGNMAAGDPFSCPDVLATNPARGEYWTSHPNRLDPTSPPNAAPCFLDFAIIEPLALLLKIVPEFNPAMTPAVAFFAASIAAFVARMEAIVPVASTFAKNPSSLNVPFIDKLEIVLPSPLKLPLNFVFMGDCPYVPSLLALKLAESA